MKEFRFPYTLGAVDYCAERSTRRTASHTDGEQIDLVALNPIRDDLPLRSPKPLSESGPGTNQERLFESP